jgi:hypothetical protein
MNAMRQVSDEYHLPLHLAMLADLKSKEGDLASAQELYEQAADVTETLLTNSPNEEIKSSLIATMSDVYKGNFAVTARLEHFRLSQIHNITLLIANAKANTPVSVKT